MTEKVALYDALAVDYDRFVDWEGRLAYELPFFVCLLGEYGVRRVLDAACGTGHHAIALAKQGWAVTGADLSAVMIEQARENASAAGVDVAFHVLGFGQLSSLEQRFDAVLCLGNSLPHLLNAQAIADALADFAAVLRPGSLLVIQNRNFDRVWAERERFMSPQSHREGRREWLFIRFYDFHQETITFNVVRLLHGKEGWTQETEATTLRPVFYKDLATALASVGLIDITFYGGCDGSPFESERSPDLISVAVKGDGR
jgi:glycine/sarcosine N-methyltransferase